MLRFFNCLKEPSCKSLILLNLRSLEHKGKLRFNFLIMYYFARNFNIYLDFCPVVSSHSCRSNLSCSNPKAISLTQDPYKSGIFHLKNNLTFYFRKKNQNTIQYWYTNNILGILIFSYLQNNISNLILQLLNLDIWAV